MGQKHYSSEDAEIKYVHKKQTDSTGDTEQGHGAGHCWSCTICPPQTLTQTRKALLRLVSKHATPLTSSLDS